MKKLLMIMLGLGLGLTIMSCSGSETEELIQSDEQVLAIEAISSSMLLSYNESTVEEMANPMNQMGFSEEEIENLDYYVEMVETFLGNDQLEVETAASDNAEYEYMIVYTTLGINQEQLTYKLYYNVYDLEEEVTTEEATTEEATTEEATTEEETTEEATTEEATTEEATTNDPTTEPLAFNTDRVPAIIFNDEDDESVIQLIKGIMVFGEVTYEVEGKILSVNGKEITRIRSFIDEDNFVLVNYQIDESEVDKEKFFFQMVQDGVVVSRSKVMIFDNDNRQHVQVEIIEGEDYARYQFHVREDGDVTYIHINYRIETSEETNEGNIRLTKTIDPETNEAIYAYQVTPNQGQGKGSQFNKRHHNRYNTQQNNQTTM